MKKIYVSGKITGLKIEDAQAKFAEAATRLKAMGHEPVNPMEHVPYHPEWDWHDYMKADVKLICDCDAIYMLDNWHDSKGAIEEHRIATLTFNMPAYFHHDNHF